MKIQNSIFALFKKYLFYTLVFTLLLSPFAYIVSVYATPIYGKYPGTATNPIGLFKMSLNKIVDRGQIGMSSSRSYDSNHIAAYSAVKNSTRGYPEMSSTTWPNGYNMIQNNWTGTWNQYVDILITFQNRGLNVSGGETFRYAAPSSYCSIWGQSYPCGARPTIVMNTYKWDGNSTPYYAPMTSASKQRLIVHETGHAVGMMDYCSGSIDSIMNNGATTCNSGRWTAITGYKATDRSAVNSVYK